jgi:glycosidase
MPWSAEPGGGFTEPGVEPWLPFGDLASANVEDQRRDPGSTLSFTRDLIQLRAAIPELRAGEYAALADTPDGVWAWTRSGRLLVVLNLAGAPRTVDGVTGLVRLTTTRISEGDRVDGTLTLAADEGAVVWLDSP